jgi:hypothetical protein
MAERDLFRCTAWKVADRHTAIDYAHALKDLSDTHFPDAAKIVLVQDNLSTHKPASLYEGRQALGAFAEASLLPDRSRAGFQSTHHCRDSPGIGAAADPNGDAVDLHLDLSGDLVDLGQAPTPPASRRAFQGRCLNNRRHEQIKSHRQWLPRPPSPSKKLLRRQTVQTRHGADRLATGHALSDDPHLVLCSQRSRSAVAQSPEYLDVRPLIAPHTPIPARSGASPFEGNASCQR